MKKKNEKKNVILPQFCSFFPPFSSLKKKDDYAWNNKKKSTQLCMWMDVASISTVKKETQQTYDDQAQVCGRAGPAQRKETAPCSPIFSYYLRCDNSSPLGDGVKEKKEETLLSSISCQLASWSRDQRVEQRQERERENPCAQFLRLSIILSESLSAVCPRCCLSRVC